MGTPDFAVPSLKALIREFDVKAVLTQPDKPKGRGKKLAMSPVKDVAIDHNIPVYQPLKLRKDEETLNEIRTIQPDYIVVVAFGQILSKEVLDIPKYGCINLHASLLPKYRGAAPLNWAIIKGEKVSGNTTMLMDEGLDTGDMLLKEEVPITEDMTASELHDILMDKGANLLVETLKKYKEGKINPIKQGEPLTDYASMLNKKMAEIKWNSSAKDVHNFIRGLNAWPVAYTYYEDNVMKIYKSKVVHCNLKEKPGTILQISDEGIKVACGEGAINIEMVQFPGKKPMYVKDYIRGNNIREKTILGK